jgi:arylsulfatase
MKQVFTIHLIILTVTGIFFTACTNNHENSRPNIIYILADDLGYGELGCYGQTKIETPNIDEMAEQGMKFTQHYSGSPVCAPSRCVLLTGRHSGHAYIRGNHEWSARGDVWDYLAMFNDSSLEGQYPLAGECITVGELLQEAGYKTAVVGKWGLGAPHTHGIPTRQGFDFFYGYNCQRQAHTYYPLHLYKNENRVYLGNDTVPPRIGLEEGADPFDPVSYDRFNLDDFAPALMFEEILGFVEQNRQDPFFLYWATPIPHVPLQSTEEWIRYYVDKFGDEEPYLADRGYYPHRYPHACYAAMISYLDEQVGLLVDRLKKLGIYENTLIIFSSDNGPSYAGGADSPWFDSGGPFLSEKGWGKGTLQEGGIRVPMIASWPGKIRPGSVSDHISAFWDVLPTLCEVAGTKVPEGTDGISFLPELQGKKEQRKHEYLYWEYPSSGGQQAVRMDRWKALRKNINEGNLEIELYDLENDLQEQHDLAARHPEIAARMEQILQEAHLPSEIERFKMKALGD